MNRMSVKLAPTLLALGVIAAVATAPVAAQAPAVDKKAVEILKKTMEYLGSLDQFSVDTQLTFEEMLDSGHRIDNEVSATTTIRRPNKLRAERHGDHINQIFYYDGATLTLHNPADKVYAKESAPDTIEEMLHFAFDSLGIGTPVSDLVYRDAFPLMMQDVNLAIVVGKEVIGGVNCTHLLFSRPGVDFQIWVPESGQPLPLKYVVTDTLAPELLSISAITTNWNTNPEVPDALFSFEPPEGTTQITFLKIDSTTSQQH